MQATVRKLGQGRWHQACTWYFSVQYLSYYVLLLSGNAVFSLNDDLLLVDNLVDGFDLYQYPRTSPSESFHIPREKAYVHGCAFVGGELVACGSDHGLVYLYSLETGLSAGKLMHGSRNAMVQVIEVF